MTIQEEIHTEIPTHRENRVERKKASRMKSFKMTHKKEDISLQVFKDSSDKFQLHYLPDETRFHLIKKGKVENDIIPQVLKGKQGGKLKWYPPKEGGCSHKLISASSSAWNDIKEEHVSGWSIKWK
ncbi:hypothetical protein PVK06_040106 [Gossypium arboreum]|uniref:Uncharacterized protein n=1 Tax=Gossypium arboreum TaxID=29729 RepID=A0ABR0N4L8_GOSAR|nr:hypothetical protein PVK06_040106 [Gossypium arboreum]